MIKEHFTQTSVKLQLRPIFALSGAKEEAPYVALPEQWDKTVQSGLKLRVVVGYYCI